jgi:hypothetical protein
MSFFPPFGLGFFRVPVRLQPGVAFASRHERCEVSNPHQALRMQRALPLQRMRDRRQTARFTM